METSIIDVVNTLVIGDRILTIMIEEYSALLLVRA